MGDHGLWNRGNFSFNGKYPEFFSLKVLACGRVMRWKPECCGGRSSKGKHAGGRLRGLACIWDARVMAMKGGHVSPSAAPAVPPRSQHSCTTGSGPGKDLLAWDLGAVAAGWTGSPRTPGQMRVVLPCAGRWCWDSDNPAAARCAWLLGGGPGPGLGAPREWGLGIGPGRGWVGTSSCVLAPQIWHVCSSLGADPRGAVSGTGLDPAPHAL